MIQKDTKQEEINFAILATDIVCFRIIDAQLCVLLGAVNVPPHFINSWGVIGGLILPKETADQSVARHLRNKAGIEDIYTEQVYTFSGVNRDPRGRVVSLAYMALSGANPQRHKGKIETQWQPVNKLPKLAYDHSEIVRIAIERLRAKLGYTNIAQNLLPRTFTLSQLQEVYETVLNKNLDKRNFRKKILGIKLVRDTGRMYQEGAMRPAALYEFSSKDMQVIEIL